MCRFMVYKGDRSMLMADLLTRPARSVVTQSYASLERFQNNPLNGDGFGVGWYVPADAEEEAAAAAGAAAVDSGEEVLAATATALQGTANGGITFEAAAPLSMPPPRPDPAVASEMARLRLKLDDLAGEVARREGELTARAWRITELEKELARLERAHEEARKAKPAARPMGTESADLGAELARAQDELDALRQALAQEHAARVAAESGEELARARSELARQAVLLEQMRGRVDNV